MGMKTVTAAEANRNFAKLVQEARNGEDIVVTAHGVPVVTISRFQKDQQAEKLAREAAWSALWDRIDQQAPTTIRWKFNRDELYDD
jgi:prevent-host-death family protein